MNIFWQKVVHEEAVLCTSTIVDEKCESEDIGMRNLKIQRNNFKLMFCKKMKRGNKKCAGYVLRGQAEF